MLYDDNDINNEDDFTNLFVNMDSMYKLFSNAIIPNEENDVAR